METALDYKNWISQDGSEHTGHSCEVLGQFTVIDCERCRFKHVVPLPTEKELETVYSHEYYTREKPLYIERYLEDLPWWTSIYNERFARIEEALNGRTGKLLDVGSGPGLFLSTGVKRGWLATGIEPSVKAAKYSKEDLGLNVLNTFLTKDNAGQLGKFDAVHMGEVLEHLPNPYEMLRIVSGLLRPGGVLSLIVPNDFNPFQNILKSELGFTSWWVAPPHHLNYFDHKSLEELIVRAGFEIIDTTSTFPIDIFLLMGQCYVGDDEKGRVVHQLRKAFDTTLLAGAGKDLRRQILKQFANLSIGREIDIICKRPDASSF